jgi:hypothetical protein
MNLLIVAAITAALGTGPDIVPPDQARRRFVLEQVPLALSWHGAAALLYFEPGAVPAKAGVYLAGASLGYAGTLLATGWLPMTEAQVHFGTALAYRGVLAGHSLDAWVKFNPWPNRVLAMWTGSVTAEAAGLALGRRLTPGQAELTLVAIDFGTLQGLCAGTIVNDVVLHSSLWSTLPSGGILPGQVAGAVAGAFIARDWQGTEGQAQMIRAGSLVGAALTGAAWVVISGRTDLRGQSIAAGIGSAGSIAGALLVARAVRGWPLPAGNGWRVAAAGVSGLLAGATAGYAFRGIKAGIGAGAVGAATRLATELLLAYGPGLSHNRSTSRFTVNFDAVATAGAQFGLRGSFAAPCLVTIRF